MRTLRAIAVISVLGFCVAARADDYVVVVSKATQADAAWAKVVQALVDKHHGSVIVYDQSPAEALPQLKQRFPRFTCFVARPTEATRLYAAEVHRITRQYDDDPYTDTLWGIVTGYDADNALAIARYAEPLMIRKTAAGTEIALEKCVEGIWYCELKQHHMVRKSPDSEAAPATAPADTTKPLVDTLNDYHADLFVTSGHATERDWQIGYTYRNGYFRSKDGQLFGVDTQGNRHPIHSPNPKVYMPIGNCLMGHIDGSDAMALAFMKSAGVHQMLGYTVPTWYGYAGWGVLDYFVEQPGRYTFAEAFFVNQHALIHRIATCFPDVVNKQIDPGQMTRLTCQVTDTAKQLKLNERDAMGLLFDRDTVAFYGDPAWHARMADGPKSYEQTLTENDGVYTFTITPNLGEKSFNPVNTNGAQRGWRPIVHLLPHRIQNVTIVEGEDLQPVVADDFILVPNPRTCDVSRAYRVVFKAKRVD